MRRTRNALYLHRYRGFESPPLRLIQILDNSELQGSNKYLAKSKTYCNDSRIRTVWNVQFLELSVISFSRVDLI